MGTLLPDLLALLAAATFFYVLNSVLVVLATVYIYIYVYYSFFFFFWGGGGGGGGYRVLPFCQIQRGWSGELKFGRRGRTSRSSLALLSRVHGS